MNLKTKKIVAIAVVAVLAIGGVAFGLSQKKSVDFANINEGSFKIHENVVVSKDAESKELARVDIYFDVACGACAAFGDATRTALTNFVTSGQVDVVYHPVAFVATDASNPYSITGGTYALAMAEYAPEAASKFVETIVSQDFLMEIATNTEIDPTEELNRIVLELTDEATLDKIKSTHNDFKSTLKASTDTFTKSADILALSSYEEDGKAIIATPFVTVNKVGENTSKSLLIMTIEDSVTLLNEQINAITQ